MLKNSINNLISRIAAEPSCESENDSMSNKFFRLNIVIALLLGFFLRIYMLADQVLLDDEWHAIDYVPGKSFFYLLTHYGSSAHSIPMNLYRWFLLQTVGWNEMLLRMPSLIAGSLGIIVFPLILQKIISRRPIVFFSYFLAISPLLIFYSRVSRGYSAVAFLVFIAVLNLYLWIRERKKSYAIAYIIAGGLAVYFNFFALVGVLSPLGFVLLLYLVKTNSIASPEMPAFRYFAAMVFSLLAFLALLLTAPVVLSPFPKVPAADAATIKSLIGVVSLLCGTSNPILIFVFVAAGILGFLWLCRNRFRLCGILAFMIVFYFLAIVSVKHHGINIPLEISRFVIPLFPVGLLLVALGFETMLKAFWGFKNLYGRKWGRWAGYILIGCFLVISFYCGPIPSLYRSTNNFMNHSVYQGSYKKIQWDRPYTNQTISDAIVTSTTMPLFYKFLSNDAGSDKIIEYPMFVGDNFNFYYYYQHVHKKKIAIGFINSILNSSDSNGHVFGNDYVDYILSRIRDVNRLNFRNLINLSNLKRIKNGGYDYIILHKNLLKEMFQLSDKTKEASLNDPYLFHNGIYQPVRDLADYYLRIFGSPVFESNDIVVFRVN